MKRNFQDRFYVKALGYFLMFFIIIEFNTPYTYFPAIGRVVSSVPLIILGLFLLLNLKNIKIEILVIMLFIGALLPSLNVAEGQFIRYVKLYMLLLPFCTMFFLMLNKIDKEDGYKLLLLRFSNIAVCFAVVSLFFWIVGSLLEIIPYTIMIPNSWGEERFIPTYYGIYFETQDTRMPWDTMSIVIRNSGIFNEAPMHNMILCTALSIELFLRKELSKLRVGVLFATVLTTLSTTGYILLVIMAILKSYIMYGSRLRRIIFVFIPLLLIVSVFILPLILESKKETGEGSYNNRSDDILKCLEVGFENPILGVELFHMADEGGAEKYNYGYSNSLFGIFAHGGLYVFSLYFCSLFLFPIITYRRTKDINLLSMQMCYFLLFTFTLSEYKYLTIFIMSLNVVNWDGTKRLSHLK